MGAAESMSATLHITNMSDHYSLINPQIYIVRGYCDDPAQPTISSNKTEVCTFTENTGRGAVGVLTYDLCQMENQVCSDRMAILFSVSKYYNLYRNIMGVGVFKITRECDNALYRCMYEGNDISRFTRGNAEVSGITYKGESVELRATMSNVGKAIIKLEIHDRLGQKCKNKK